MARTYLVLTQDDIDAKLADHILSREMELLSYDFERDSHTAAIAAYGEIAWDAKTVKYRNLTRDAMIAAALNDGLDAGGIQTISDLQALDAHKRNLAAVLVETKKSEQHYTNLLSALPAGTRRDAALTVVKDKLATDRAEAIAKVQETKTQIAAGTLSTK